MDYAADFETTTDANDCRVWCWGLCNIETPGQFIWGKNINDLFDRFTTKSVNLYFHNLKFDGEFILYWLFRNGYKHVTNIKELETKTFSTLISDKKAWYSITICQKKRKRNSIFINIFDSLKIIPFGVEKVAKSFKLPITKLEIDYKKPRPVGYMLTQTEIDYLKNDVTIMALALQVLFNKGLTAMTTGSNALKEYKRIITPKAFERTFPSPPYDADVRQAYRGGFTYLAPRYAGKKLGAGIVLDYNSLYPSIMYNDKLPYGEGLYYDGEYQQDDIYTIYVQMLTCNFELKKDHIPTIQLKRNPLFSGTEYITSSKGQDVTMCLTSVDLKLFLDHYDVYNIEYHSGWKFKAVTGLFKEYIDYWSGEKIKAGIEGNSGMYVLSKLMLNSLYGKFSSNPNVTGKIPYYDETEDFIKFAPGEPEYIKPVYIPVGVFITSYGREKTIRAAQSCYDVFVYADTDSLHLLTTEPPKHLDIDKNRLGALKHEYTFSRAKFIRAKTYIEYGKDPDKNEPESLKVTCAGFSEKCHSQITFDNFEVGAIYTNQLRPVRVSGGVVLEDYEKRINDKTVFF